MSDLNGEVEVWAAPTLRPCSNDRCHRRGFDAKIIKVRGAPVDVVLDGQPKTWAEGARIKLVDSRHLPHQRVKQLTAASIREAFGVRALYVEHAEVCEAEQRKKKAKKVDGHA